MDDANRSPANPLWDFSIALYARPAAAQACLGLQDRDGLDVNLLLFCVWVAASGRGRLSEGEIAQAVAVLAPWRARAIEPLRKLRRILKDDAAGVTQAAIQGLRQEIAAAELTAERIGQDLLAAIVTRPAGTKPNADNATENLAAYLRLAGVALNPATSADLGVLLAATFPAATCR